MTNVGFTTGSLRKSEFSFDEKVKIYYSAGANAIELSFPELDKLVNYNLSEQAEKDIFKFDSISIHAPWIDIRYDDNAQTRDVIERLRAICNKLPVGGIVLHPDMIDNFDILNTSGLPFLLENMDKRKAYGTQPDEFREFRKKYNFGFVLDVQHVYEHDPSMELAKEFISIMGDRLKHMHVSGCSELGGHVPVYNSDNKEAIIKVLKLGLNVPIILEGVLMGDVCDSMSRELECIRNSFK